MNKNISKTATKSCKLVYSTLSNTNKMNSIKVYEPNRTTDVTINCKSSVETIKKDIKPLLAVMERNDLWHLMRCANPKLLLLLSLQFCTYEFLLSNNIKVEDAVEKLKYRRNPNLVSKFSKDSCFATI
jgi:hypothetical protein